MRYDRSRGFSLQTNNIFASKTVAPLYHVHLFFPFLSFPSPVREKLQQFPWLNENLIQLNWMYKFNVGKDKDKVNKELDRPNCDLIKSVYESKSCVRFALSVSYCIFHFYHLDSSWCDDWSNYVCCENVVKQPWRSPASHSKDVGQRDKAHSIL